MFARIREIMLSKTMAEWMELFDAVGAPVSPVNFPEEMADDPQVAAMGYMYDMEHPLTGPERMPGALLEMSKTPVGSYKTSPPLAWDTTDVLKESGLSDEEIQQLIASGATTQADR